ncbi:hypothetical protein AHAS_Ahas07G0167300 [Arachis hypogaea]
MVGFMMNIRKITITNAELWAIYTGLKIAIGMGMEMHASADLHDCTSLIRAFRDLQANPGDF